MGKEGYEPVQTASLHLEAAAHAHRARRRLTSLASIACGLVLGSLIALALITSGHSSLLQQMAGTQAAQPQKLGAGMLFSSGDQVLLLRRSSKHNDNTWGLPGGNYEEGDANLQVTAQREATEEMGSLPGHLVTASLLTKRGKHQQKHYTVYVASVSEEERAAYVPELNHEHSEWKWWDVSELSSLDTQPALHPVVVLLMQDPLRQQLAAHLPSWGAQQAGSSAADTEEDQAEAEEVAAFARGEGKIKKLGAGLLLVHGEQVLLLKRNSSHNNETWDIPGGNTELDDVHLFAAARRESEEEMGPLPAFIQEGAVKGQILTKRGKHDSKHFTVFVLESPDDFRDSFTPQLSDESLAWKWWDLEDVAGLKLKHPRLEMLFTGKYRKQLEKILGQELDD